MIQAEKGPREFVLKASMKEFLGGWRRKAGVTTLAMALFLWCIWARSIAITDHLSFPFPVFGVKVFVLRSHQGEIGWQDLSMFPTYVPVGWSSHQFTRHDRAIEEFRLSFVTMPYWRIVIPVTLLSAYLILWKPPKHRSIAHSVDPEL